MTLQQAMEKNPYDCNKGNLSSYAKYISYNVDGMYHKNKMMFKKY